MGPHRLMIVDDERHVLKSLERSLACEQWLVESFTDPAEALRRARVAVFDLFLCDLRMPHLDGLQLLGELRSLQPEAMRILISACGDFDSVVAAINGVGVERFIAKPWNTEDLRHAIATALEKRDLFNENRRLADELRRAERTMAHQRDELARLEKENPGLTRVRWAKDGSILLGIDDV